MRGLEVILATALAAGSVGAAPVCQTAYDPQKWEQAVVAAEKCVRAAAIVYERSRERPEDIATAALVECGQLIDSSVAASQSCYGSIRDWPTSLRQTMRDLAAASVVQVRANRYAPPEKK